MSVYDKTAKVKGEGKTKHISRSHVLGKQSKPAFDK